MLKAAYVFEEASRLLFNEVERTSLRQAVPAAVTGAFSVEVYLKCLLVIEHGVAPPEEHNLKELFRLLPRQTKETLTKRHNALTEKDPNFEHVRKQFGKKSDLASLLEEGQDAFTLLRYAYEGLPPRWIGFSLNIFAWCIRERILKLHPDWKQW